jgi:membrane protein DedA with SNARE-associated domain
MLEYILAQYGYIALFIGAFFEGEVIVVVSGILASLGYLSLWPVIATAMVATFIGDQTFFLIGRKKGKVFIEKRPHIRERAEKVHELLHGHQNKILFGFRFLYGLRIPTLIALGTSEISQKKFLIFNVINSVIWTLGFVLGGYFFGDIFETVLKEIGFYEKQLFIGLAVFGLIVWVWSLIKHRRDY